MQESHLHLGLETRMSGVSDRPSCSKFSGLPPPTHSSLKGQLTVHHTCGGGSGRSTGMPDTVAPSRTGNGIWKDLRKKPLLQAWPFPLEVCVHPSLTPLFSGPKTSRGCYWETGRVQQLLPIPLPGEIFSTGRIAVSLGINSPPPRHESLL